MIIQTEHLGKVSVTVEKDYHNINKCYDKLTIVEEENEFRTYISRKPVPNGVELTDRNYWIPFSSLERQIVIDYNKFKNDVLFASAFHEKLDPTLPEGIAIIKQLFDKDNNLIIPKVSEEAVSDETGKTLKAKLAELTTTLSNTIDTYLNTYFADTIEKAEDIVNHPTYIGEDNYVYVWNRITKTYDKTSIYTRGEGFHVSKTFASVADMEAYIGTDLKEGDFVLIQSTPDDPDNAKLYTYSGTQGVYNYLVDMSGALGFAGKTPQFSIGSVITVNPDVPASASLSPDGTDADGNPKYKLNLALPKGAKGESDFVVVEDHSGAGDDPNKVYIPSAESHKEVYDGLIEDEDVLSKAVNIINKKFIDHINNSSLHKTIEDYELIEQANNNIAVLQKHIFNGYDYLDLNLPSGTIWASKNIGANTTFDIGSYFMWGDTKERSEASEFVATDCLYTADGVTFIDKYKKYISPNPTRTIRRSMATKDDPANAMLGGKWKVPTFAQIEELFSENYIEHNSGALGNWIKISNGKHYDHGWLMQLPISPYLLEGNEVGDLNTIYLMYNDITGIDDFKVAKVVLSISSNSVAISSITEESVPAWAGVVIRPVIA